MKGIYLIIRRYPGIKVSIEYFEENNNTSIDKRLNRRMFRPFLDEFQDELVLIPREEVQQEADVEWSVEDGPKLHGVQSRARNPPPNQRLSHSQSIFVYLFFFEIR